ncbi:DUF6923 family protein [Aureispira anguillae]|uniref:Gliding motility-associated C-terminal domain-containing protein n=1 Tax=Aureispira anguillae TaxID=2864201 RepID=A0A916DWW9_9BACT|nr:gliding motility-associated C-terminal domain-containing protein [Aureispira anguillae]BDS15267.1 gliding motility-associated C-terminal domain-containing protein [Aureispira anguillae]
MLKVYLLIFWIVLPFALSAQNYDICGDGIDNDNDGLIDEACLAFECDGSLYQSAKQGNDFFLYKVNTNPVQFITVANLTQNGGIQSFNSLAYNPVDNLMYGMGTNDDRIYRIDAAGNVEFLGNVSGLSSFKNAGTFDQFGNYYVFGDNTLRKINISTLTYNTIGGVGTYGSADIVFNPLDNQIYGWSGNPKLLFKMDPNTGVQTKIPGNAPLAINGSWGWTGALYFNPQGDILGYQGSKMIKFDPNTGIGSLVGTGASKSSNDGCSCSFGVEMTKSVSGTFEAGDTIRYHFEFFNQSFSSINNLIFDDILTNGFKWSGNPYNLSNLSLSGNTLLSGTSTAHFTIDNLPQGTASFDIDVIIPCNYNANTYTNQAVLSNLPPPLKDTILSDNPNTLTIGDPTTFSLSTPPLNLQTISKNIICERNIGSIELQATGGSQPLSYLWSNGQTDSIATGLGVGNYTVTITGSTGCAVSTSATIIAEQVNITTYASVQNVQCQGGKNGLIRVDSSTGGYPPYHYALNQTAFDSALVFDSLMLGNYMLQTKDAFGCRGQAVFSLTEPLFKLALQAPSDTIVKIGDWIAGELEVNTLTPVVYEWSPKVGLSCYDCQTPLIQAPTTTTYTIKGTDILGCSDSTSFTITVEDDSRVFIPNAFSPNGDGNNDVLMIYSPGDVQEVKSFRIFSRWGELVFEQQNFPPNYATYGWDGHFQGQPMNSGIFVYYAEIQLIDGRTEVISGDVSLFR